MKNTITSLIILVLFAGTTAVSDQCNEWNWPEGKKIAEEKVALLQDAVNAKKYRQD